MNQWQEETRSKFVAVSIVGGIGAIVVGIPLSIMGFGAAASSMPYHREAVSGNLGIFILGLLLIVAGVVAIVVALVSGFWFAKSMNKGPRTLERNVRVLARYGVDKQQGMVLEERIEDGDPDVTCYVKIVSPIHGVMELRCAPEVYFSCGEGSIGDAYMEGRWLGRYVPYVGGVPPAYPAEGRAKVP